MTSEHDHLENLDKNIFEGSQDYVKLGEIIYTDKPEDHNLLGLGTCLAIFIFDLKRHQYALAHVLLPSVEGRSTSQEALAREQDKPGRYTDEAIHTMVKHMIQLGSDRRSIKAKLAGGGQIYKDPMMIGDRNIEVAHRVLAQEKIEIVAEEVGGSHSRSVLSFNRDGTMDIRKSGSKFQI